MRNDKLNKIMGIPSIILGLLYLICYLSLYVMEIQNIQLKYNLIKNYLMIAYSFALIIIVLIMGCCIRYNRRQIKPFSKKTTIGWLSLLIALMIIIKSNNALLSSIIILFVGISLIYVNK